MLDASRGFIKDGNKNRLRAQDLHKIVDTFNRQLEVPRYARRVPLAEIAANDYNLNLPRYIDATEPEDLHDLEAHLRGGIPAADVDALHDYWRVFPKLRATLFEDDRPGYLRLRLPATDIKPAILGHAEFAAFTASIGALFQAWRAEARPRLAALAPGDHAKGVIDALSEALLERFRAAPLLDPYAVYQHLMDYWADTLQDDVHQIVQVGWQPALDGAPNTDLIPPALLIARFFAAEQAAIDALETEREALARQIEEAEEEQSGEESLFAEARNERGKLTAKGIKDRLKAIKSDPDPDAADERTALQAQLALIEAEAAAAKKVKDATRALDAQVRARYAMLEAEAVQALVIDDKWLAALADVLQAEIERVSQTLTGRVRELAERYEAPLPALAAEVETLSARVEEHLRRMGVAWE